MSLTKTSAALGSLALLTTAWFSVAGPPDDPAPFGGINLGQSVITLTHTSQIKTKLTAIGWQEAANGVNIAVHPQNGVLLRVGGSLGENATNVPQDRQSVVEIRKYDATTLKAELVITPPPPSVVTRTPLTIVTRGDYDDFAKVEPPHLEEFGYVPDDPTRQRLRLWVNYYGMRTAITFMDG